ncbi:hypothetical protein LX32DRAFT_289870 [Colletotrichum zoysiae]|uniref:Uncharacterized protein n=1 Tax=Colletotrichum zoysiae TaxID=1216348 RepID=A0AAD9H2S9_9PEZI|nr:hypothetical protein LX32DRAFT_289870 [Colletotrichum zoysiae]
MGRVGSVSIKQAGRKPLFPFWFWLCGQSNASLFQRPPPVLFARLGSPSVYCGPAAVGSPRLFFEITAPFIGSQTCKHSGAILAHSHSPWSLLLSRQSCSMLERVPIWFPPPSISEHWGPPSSIISKHSAQAIGPLCQGFTSDLDAGP